MLFAQTVDELQKVATSDQYTLQGVLLVLLGVVFLAIGYGCWRFFPWAGTRVDSFIARAYSHLDSVDATMGCLRDSIGSIVPRLKAIEDKVDTVAERVDTLDKHVNKDQK